MCHALLDRQLMYLFCMFLVGELVLSGTDSVS